MGFFEDTVQKVRNCIEQKFLPEFSKIGVRQIRLSPVNEQSFDVKIFFIKGSGNHNKEQTALDIFDTLQEEKLKGFRVGEPTFTEGQDLSIIRVENLSTTDTSGSKTYKKIMNGDDSIVSKFSKELDKNFEKLFQKVYPYSDIDVHVDADFGVAVVVDDDDTIFNFAFFDQDEENVDQLVNRPDSEIYVDYAELLFYGIGNIPIGDSKSKIKFGQFSSDLVDERYQEEELYDREQPSFRETDVIDYFGSIYKGELTLEDDPRLLDKLFKDYKVTNSLLSEKIFQTIKSTIRKDLGINVKAVWNRDGKLSVVGNHNESSIMFDFKTNCNSHVPNDKLASKSYSVISLNKVSIFPPEREVETIGLNEPLGLVELINVQDSNKDMEEISKSLSRAITKFKGKLIH